MNVLGTAENTWAWRLPAGAITSLGLPEAPWGGVGLGWGGVRSARW